LKKRTIGIALSAIILAAAFGLAGTGAASAESVNKICGEQWKQAKASGSTNGMTWKDFLAQCHEQQKGAAPAAPAPAAAAAPAPAAAPVVTAAAGGKTAKECNAEYAANKEAIKASGQKKKDFVEACRAGTETVPPAAAPAAAAPAPAAAPPPAAPPPAAAPAPKPAAAAKPKPAAAATGAGDFKTEAEAKGRCPTDTVVWVNTKSSVYHFAGTHSYGTTKQGAYMCEADAKAAGHRASEKEKHP
jgi:hypothetical protein